MKALNTTIREFLDGTKQFAIPVFQRDYTWEEGNWRQIWDDICRDAAVDGGPGHFVGSIVHVKDNALAAMNRFLVIDGQQRLTTFSILCAALRDHIRNAGWDDTPGGPTPEQIDGMLLRNHLQTGDAAYKLVLRRADDETLRAVVDCKPYDTLAGVRSDLVARAYNYFLRRLDSPETDLIAVWEGAMRTRIVEIGLELPADDPQSIFESMNSTGVSLTPGDLVRNYLLMGLNEHDQTRLYSDYWRATEEFFRGAGGTLDDDLFDAFLRHYLVLKLGKNEQGPRHRTYEEFKENRNRLQGNGTLEELLQDIRRFAKYYAAFQGRVTLPSAPLAEPMKNLRSRGVSPAVLVMRLYDCYESGGGLSESDFARALGIIESYLFRRAIMGNQTRWGSYYRIFANIARDIPINTGTAPLDMVAETLRRWEDWYWWWRFPRDDEFTKALQENDLYAMGNNCKHLLDRLENHDVKEPSPVGEYSIEHIMPQSLGSEWKKMLGKDWQQVHNTWLHRLGNLTLTGYNPEMSNRPFEVKKTSPRGFNQAAVRLNQFVREQPEWTSAEMEQRGKELAERALWIWPYPQSNEA